MTSSIDKHHFKIGHFIIGVDDHTITDETGLVEHLQPKFIEVLHYLALQYPELVSREELIENIWNGNQYVGEKALTNAIWNIRKKLEQHPNSNQSEYIQTVRKSGYRLTEKPLMYVEKTAKPVSQHSRLTSRLKWWPLVSIFACILILSLYFVTKPSIKPVVKITSLTSSPGREAYPAVSRDGTKMAFYWKRINKDQDLFYIDLTRPDLAPVQLTYDSEMESRPVWSYNADKIFYIQKSWDRKFCNVIELDVKTRLKKRIAPCIGNVNPSLSISSNGNTLAFASFDDTYNSVGIYLLDLTAKDKTPIRFSCGSDCELSDRDVVFSPDGSQLLMTSRTQLHEEDIFLVDRVTKKTNRLTEGLRNIQGMAWHPNSNKIIFSAEYADVRNGYVLDLDTNALTALDVEGFSFPSFIGNTNELVFHERKIKKFISTLEVDTNNAAIPFPLIQSDYTHSFATYSLAAKKIAYISNQSGAHELWMYDETGSKATQLTNLNSNLIYPNWSPDGKHIAFLVRHTASNETSIRIINVDNKSIVTLTPKGLTRFSMPTWSNDNKQIYTNASRDGNSAYFSIDISTSAFSKISDRSGGMIILDSAKDIMWYSRGNEAIYQAKISDPANSETVLIESSTMINEFSWTKTKQGIFFLQRYTDHERINFYSFEDSSIVSILKAPLRTIESGVPLSYMEDKNQLLLTQSVFPQIDIKRLSHPLLEN